MQYRTLLSYRSWRHAAAAAIYLTILAQVPALAAYSLGTWTETAGPQAWTVTGSGLGVALTPQVGFTGSTETFVFAAPVTGSASNVTASTSNFNAFQVSAFGTGGLKVYIGFDPSNNPAGHPTKLIYSNAGNQFNTGTLPASLPGTYSSVNPSGGFAVVQFVFTGPAVWGPTTVPSSPVRITYTAGD